MTALCDQYLVRTVTSDSNITESVLLKNILHSSVLVNNVPGYYLLHWTNSDEQMLSLNITCILFWYHIRQKVRFVSYLRVFKSIHIINVKNYELNALSNLLCTLFYFAHPKLYANLLEILRHFWPRFPWICKFCKTVMICVHKKWYKKPGASHLHVLDHPEIKSLPAVTNL